MEPQDWKRNIFEAAVAVGLGLFVLRYLVKEFGECLKEIIEQAKAIKKKWTEPETPASREGS
jgi:hypothetical protein